MIALFCHRGKRLFLLKGKTNKEKRMRIYKFLLEHFTDEQRFNVTSKICLSILGMSGVFGVNVFLECSSTEGLYGRHVFVLSNSSAS